MQAVILACGKGTRLGNVELPKVMFKICNTPVLEYQIELLKKYGVKDIVFCVKYLSGIIREYFGDGRKFGVSITYSEEKEFLGTAGAIGFAEDKIKGDFILFYGDVMLNIDLAKLMKYHKEKNGVATLVVRKSDHPQDSDLVEMDSEGMVKRLLGKPRPDQKFKNITNAALYVLKKQVLNHVPKDKPTDFGKDIFPEIIKKGLPVYGYFTDEYIKDMGTPERLRKVEKDMREGRIIERRAVFLDRDGVINEEASLICKPSQLKLIKGSPEGIRMLKDNGFLVIAVTNQPVVARNMCNEDDLAAIHKKLESMLAGKAARLDAIYYCPHHPDKGYPGENAKYKIECECRKPKTGMINRAAQDFGIDPRKCFFIGDTTRDVQTGRNAGCRTVLVKTGQGGRDDKFDAKPDFVCENLLEASKLIIKTSGSR